MTNLETLTEDYNSLITEGNDLMAVPSADRSGEQRARIVALEPLIAEKRAERALSVSTSPETTETTEATVDSEMRERIELRSKARFGNYLDKAFRGRQVDGAESELMDAAGVSSGIPLELFETLRPAKEEHRAITSAPGTTGATFAPLVPFIFSASVAEMFDDRNATGSVSGSYVSGNDHRRQRPCGHAGKRRADAPNAAAT